MEALPARDARLLRNRLVEIADYPERFVDCEESDLSERAINVHILGRHAIRYWHDVNDRHVKILRISLADRS